MHAALLARREFLRLLGYASLAPFAPTEAFADAPVSSPPRYFGAFAEFAVGAVKPLGWTKQWLARQAAGLSGHPENMSYPYDTCMMAGVVPPRPNKHGDIWWPYEQGGYHFDATTRLNLLIDDPRVSQLHRAAFDYILANSTDRGYGASVWAWPNAVIGRGLIADHSASPGSKQSADIAALIDRYITLHGSTHDRDGVNIEEALYLYGHTGDPRLLAYASDAYKAILSPDSFCSEAKIEGSAPLKSHGVTAAELLKVFALQYLYTGDAKALDLTRRAYDKVIVESLMPDGGIVSAEYLGTSTFGSLHETCDITDWTWSIGYCLMATGDTRWADLIERTIFNALPGAITKDFKQAQYFSGANQVLCTSLSSRGSNACTRMSYRAAHETQCCVGNVNRAMPNYVIRQWMKTQDQGIAAVLYGPSELVTTIKGQPIKITQTTDYPFRDTIAFTIKASHPILFPLHLRIPGWCKTASIKVNGKPFATKAIPGSFAVITRSFKDGDKVELTLPMAVQLEDWYQGKALAVVRGPLLYSVQIEEMRVELMRDTPQIEKVLLGALIQGFPAVEFYPQSEWRYGIDPNLKANLAQIKVIESPISENPFLPGKEPVHLEVPLHYLPNWEAGFVSGPLPLPNGDSVAVKTPGSLPMAGEIERFAPPSIKRMVPSGATHLRLTTLPVI